MVTRELEHALDAGQWVFIDTSGDGGPFGFHCKMIAGSKYILTLATGGEGFQCDYLYPVIAYEQEAFKELNFMLGIYHKDDFTPMLPDCLQYYNGPEVSDGLHEAVCEAMNNCQHAMLFPDVGHALKFADWLAANLK